MRVTMVGMGWFPTSPGGLNRYFRGLAEALRAEGEDVRGHVMDDAADAPIWIRQTPALRRTSVARMIGLRRQARDDIESSDVVDAHFALSAVPALWRRRLRNTLLVVHFHGPWAAESRAVGGQTPWRIAVKRYLEGWLYKRADIVVVLSDAFRNLVIHDYGVDPSRVRVIPPGVDLERFRPGDRTGARSRFGIPVDARLVVSVRRLVPRMGIDTLITAWSRVAKPGDRLLIAGNGPERASLVSLAHALGVADSVEFLGRVDEADLVALYQAADLSVIPTRSLEGFGLVALESMAAGTPALVTDVGGLPEVVEPFDSTLVVAPTAEALATRLVGDLPDRKTCRAYAERFSWRASAQAHLNAYRAMADAPLSVVYLDHTAALSGGELALVRLLRSLKKVRPQVILAEGGNLVAELEADGVPVHVLPMPSNARAARRDAVNVRDLLGALTYALQLARLLRRLQPDLVHANSLKACLYGTIAAKLARVPVVWHVRDRIAGDYMPERTAAIIRLLGRRLPDAVIANSSSTLQALNSSKRAVVVPSPVEASSVVRVEDGVFRVGMIGRIAPWKGQHVFIEALALAFNGCDDVQGVVIGSPLFGADEDAYYSGLLEQARSINVPIEFLGFRRDIPRELARLSVLVHASVVPEPFGQVVVEGMAAGLPVVAARAGGPRDIVRDGVDGLLVPPGDPHALADALQRLRNERGLAERLSIAAPATAARFAPAAIANQVEALYAEIVRR